MDRFVTCTVECRDCGRSERKYLRASKMWRELFKKCACGSDRLSISKVEE